jgi:very-short-patch-repair endonuclease
MSTIPPGRKRSLTIAAVELDGKQHDTDPLTQPRDRLKDSLCHKAGLPLIRVRWGAWQALESLVPLLPSAE